MHTTKNEHVFRVMAALEQVFQVCRDEILTGGRPDEIAFARQVGMVALMEVYGYSTTFAARAMGRTDHGTAIHARYSVGRRIDRSQRDSAKVRAVLDLLRQADIAFPSDPDQPFRCRCDELPVKSKYYLGYMQGRGAS